MANLIIDMGNTMFKCALMEGELVADRMQWPDFDMALLGKWLEGRMPKRAIISSTRRGEEQIASALREMGVEPLIFSSEIAVPLKNCYATPETLGRDRLAAAVGADLLYPNCTLLIVDCGTALTLDVVHKGCYLGGFISPGLSMRLRALHQATASLPLVEPLDRKWEIGSSTHECIAQGVEQGICFEIEGHLTRLREKFGEIMPIFTGGDAKHFVKRIKNTIFADCDLVFVGLNRILAYHVQREK